METLDYSSDTLLTDIDRLLTLRGGQTRLAEELAVSRSTITYWVKEGVPRKWLVSAMLRTAVTKLIDLMDKGQPLSRYGVARP